MIDEENVDGNYVPAEGLPFYALETTRYTIGQNWIDIDDNSDGTYVVDSNLLEEEVGFASSDSLLDWLAGQGLLEILSHAKRN
jgi:hypothetical protein